MDARVCDHIPVEDHDELPLEPELLLVGLDRDCEWSGVEWGGVSEGAGREAVVVEWYAPSGSSRLLCVMVTVSGSMTIRIFQPSGLVSSCAAPEVRGGQQRCYDRGHPD